MRPGMPRAEVVELDNERNAVLVETSLGVELSLEKVWSLVYGEGGQPVSKRKEVHLEKRQLVSSMISVAEKK